MTNLMLGTAVHGSDEPIGRLKALICDPTTDEITHLVVNADEVPGSERLVPIEHLAHPRDDRLGLDISRHEFFELPTFETLRFFPVSRSSSSVGGAGDAEWHLPLFLSEPQAMTFVPNERIPKSEIALRRGTEVFDENRHRLGRVHAFVVDPSSHDITHLVLEESHLLHRKDVAVPVDNIDHMDETAIRLNIDAATVDRLPDLPLRRR